MLGEEGLGVNSRENKVSRSWEVNCKENKGKEEKTSDDFRIKWGKKKLTSSTFTGVGFVLIIPCKADVSSLERALVRETVPS